MSFPSKNENTELKLQYSPNFLLFNAFWYFNHHAGKDIKEEPKKKRNLFDYDKYYYKHATKKESSESPDNRKMILKEYYSIIEALQRKRNETFRKYIKLPRVKKVLKSQYIRRKSELKNIILNEKFEGSCKHHIDKKHVMYIPKEIHLLNKHNIWTKKGMEQINQEVLEWYESSNLPHYINIRSM